MGSVWWVVWVCKKGRGDVFLRECVVCIMGGVYVVWGVYSLHMCTYNKASV